MTTLGLDGNLVLAQPGPTGPVGPDGPVGPPGLSVVPFSQIAANYTLTSDDQAVTVDATTSSITVTLPPAASAPGKVYSVSKSDASINPVTIAPTGGQTIDGLPSQVLVFQYQYLMFVSDGTNWRVMASNYHGKELGYAQSTAITGVTNTALTDGALRGAKIAGLSITVVGAGRPVAVEFSGLGNNTSGSLTGAALLINGSAVGGARTSIVSQSPNSVTGIFKSRQVLTAGTPYTFEVGCWCSAATGQWIGAANLPIYLAVVGQ